MAGVQYASLEKLVEDDDRTEKIITGFERAK
jgi:hypothetical protein